MCHCIEHTDVMLRPNKEPKRSAKSLNDGLDEGSIFQQSNIILYLTNHTPLNIIT